MSGDAAGFSGGDFEGDFVGDRGDGLAAAPAASAVEAMANGKRRGIKGILTRTLRAYRRGSLESRSNLSGLEMKMLWNKPQQVISDIRSGNKHGGDSTSSSMDTSFVLTR
jgi:hypothetical protein